MLQFETRSIAPFSGRPPQAVRVRPRDSLPSTIVTLAIVFYQFLVNFNVTSDVYNSTRPSCPHCAESTVVISLVYCDHLAPFLSHCDCTQTSRVICGRRGGKGGIKSYNHKEESVSKESLHARLFDS